MTIRGKRGRCADYFKNSVTATEVHCRSCIQLAKQFPDYTVSDSQYGYVVWSGLPEIGPVVPSATGGSTVSAAGHLAGFQIHEGPLRIRGPGAGTVVNAFNPLKKWCDADDMAIDAGITMLMAENLRTGFVWKTFMQNPEARYGLRRAGLTSLWRSFDQSFRRLISRREAI